MKKNIFSFLLAICTLAFFNATASHQGRIGYSNGPQELNCTACHTSFPLNSGPGSVSITSDMVGWQYVPGQTYTISLTVQQTGMPRFGMAFEANKDTGMIGTLTSMSPTDSITIWRTRNITYNGTIRAKYGMTHNRWNIAPAGQPAQYYYPATAPDTYTWNFKWTAPSTNQGLLTFYYTGLATDALDDVLGDYCYTGTQDITPAPVPLILNCASNQTELACQSQAAIDAAFNTWLGTVTISGGCDASLTNDATVAPLVCGGSTTVNWTATSTCGTTQTCSATFTVNSAAPVTINCVSDQTAAACQTQTDVNTAFYIWLTSVTVTGGCNTVLTNDAVAPPSACGGSTLVTWTATSDCGAPVTCSATFAVTASTPVVINCATDQTENACQTQAAIDAAFNNWLATATVAGGCNAVLTNDATTAPSACGGSTLVTWTATSDCGAPVTCSATFAVTAATPVVLNCIGNQSLPAGNTQSTVDAAYAIWLSSTNFTGGCNGVLTNNSTGAPLASGGSVNVIFTVTSDCEAVVTCNATFTVAAPVPVLVVNPNPKLNFTGSTTLPSAAQTATVSGSNLADNVKVVAPDNFKVSLTGAKGSWVKKLFISRDINNNLPATTLYIKYFPTTVGQHSGWVKISSTTALVKIRVVGVATSRIEEATADVVNVTIAPNPVVNSLNLSISQIQDKVTVAVYSVTGNLIQTQQGNSTEMIMDVSNLPQGIYFCKIESGGTVVTKRFVKQ